jgi:hypothetical protein
MAGEPAGRRGEPTRWSVSHRPRTVRRSLVEMTLTRNTLSGTRPGAPPGAPLCPSVRAQLSENQQLARRWVPAVPWMCRSRNPKGTRSVLLPGRPDTPVGPERAFVLEPSGAPLRLTPSAQFAWWKRFPRGWGPPDTAPARTAGGLELDLHRGGRPYRSDSRCELARDRERCAGLPARQSKRQRNAAVRREPPGNRSLIV